jgi:hypothetical protein
MSDRRIHRRDFEPAPRTLDHHICGLGRGSACCDQTHPGNGQPKTTNKDRVTRTHGAIESKGCLERDVIRVVRELGGLLLSAPRR